MTRRRLYALATVAGLTVAAASTGASGVAPKVTYQVYEAPPATMAHADSIEPTIAANWKTGRTMIIAYTTPYVVDFNSAARTAAWTPARGITTKYTTLDPIIWGDSENGRIIVSQLAGMTSLMDITDDDGELWEPAQGGGPSGIDHQTVGGGPYAATNKPIAPTYPKGVWYCAQDVLAAFCSISTDGGRTYGPSRPIYTAAGAGPPITGCSGLHGHVNVRQDGTAMVPNKGCLDAPGTTLVTDIFGASPDDRRKIGVALNGDNNVGPWTVELVPDSTSRARMDPYVEADRANTMYVAYVDATDKLKVAVKKKGGAWATSVDVGMAAGVKSSAFPLVIAGSTGRAAVAYLGSKTGPVGILDAQDTRFAGTWQLYISTTSDSGRSWRTQQVTKDEKFPVQVGCIKKTRDRELDDQACAHRNLYDFNGITVDKLGRVMVVAADGCTPDSGCGINPRDDTNVGFIVRQECGPSLFAEQQKALDAECRSYHR